MLLRLRCTTWLISSASLNALTHLDHFTVARAGTLWNAPETSLPWAPPTDASCARYLHCRISASTAPRPRQIGPSRALHSRGRSCSDVPVLLCWQRLRWSWLSSALAGARPTDDPLRPQAISSGPGGGTTWSVSWHSVVSGDEGFEDPGWSVPLRRAAFRVIPVFGRLLIRRSNADPDSPLVTLRTIFASFCAMLVLLMAPTAAIASGGSEPTTAPGMSAAVVAAVGLSCLLGLVLVKQRPLSCGSDQELVQAFSGRFFATIALAEGSALVRFVAAVLSDSMMPYLIGAGITAWGFAMVAPTRSGLRRTQELLQSNGCHRSIGAILANPKGSS